MWIERHAKELLLSPQTPEEAAALEALEHRFKIEYQLQSSDPSVRGHALAGLERMELDAPSAPPAGKSLPAPEPVIDVGADRIAQLERQVEALTATLISGCEWCKHVDHNRATVEALLATL